MNSVSMNGTPSFNGGIVTTKKLLTPVIVDKYYHSGGNSFINVLGMQPTSFETPKKIIKKFVEHSKSIENDVWVIPLGNESAKNEEKLIIFGHDAKVLSKILPKFYDLAPESIVEKIYKLNIPGLKGERTVKVKMPAKLDNLNQKCNKEDVALLRNFAKVLAKKLNVFKPETVIEADAFINDTVSLTNHSLLTEKSVNTLLIQAGKKRLTLGESREIFA